MNNIIQIANEGVNTVKGELRSDLNFLNLCSYWMFKNYADMTSHALHFLQRRAPT